LIDKPMTIKARAYRNGFSSSVVASATYQIDPIGPPAEPIPPGTPDVGMTIIAGLSGVKSDVIDGVTTYFTNSTDKITVQITASTSPGIIEAVELLCSNGELTSVPVNSSSTTTSIDLPVTEGTWGLSARATATHGGLSASRETTPVNLLVDSTPPRLICRPAATYWLVPTIPEHLPGIAEDPADQCLVYLNANTEADTDDNGKLGNHKLRRTRGTCTYDQATFSVDAEIVDESGLRAGKFSAKTRSAFLLNDKSLTVTPNGSPRIQTLTITGFPEVKQTWPYSTPEATPVQTVLEDRCGNSATEDQFVVMVDLTVPGWAEVSGIDYQISPVRSPISAGSDAVEAWQDSVSKANRCVHGLLPRALPLIASGDASANAYMTTRHRDLAGNVSLAARTGFTWVPVWSGMLGGRVVCRDPRPSGHLDDRILTVDIRVPPAPTDLSNRSLPVVPQSFGATVGVRAGFQVRDPFWIPLPSGNSPWLADWFYGDITDGPVPAWWPDPTEAYDSGRDWLFKDWSDQWVYTGVYPELVSGVAYLYPVPTVFALSPRFAS
jgi:hypothetical protein